MPSQTETLRLYTALALYQEDWSGQLFVNLGLNETGQALALAALAAGAATLCLEPDSKQFREANRAGCLTFSVTTLDEALRALKNELRQGRAITIGLAGTPSRWLQEMVERGILPAAITASQSLSEQEQATLQTLQQWGAQPLHASGLIAIDDASRNIDVHAKAVIEEDVAETLQERRSNDETFRTQLSDALPHALQQRWLNTASTLFPRALNRAYWRSR